MSFSTDSNLKPSRIKKKSSNNVSYKKKKSKNNNKTKEYIPKRALVINENISKLNDVDFLTKNRSLINEKIYLFEGRSWQQNVNEYDRGYSEKCEVTINIGCDKRMSNSNSNISDNEFKSMLLKSDNNYINIMSNIFDKYLNGIKSIFDIILLYKGRHLLPIRCHIDLLAYFHGRIKYHKPRQNLWNKAIKNLKTGRVTIDWYPDENIFIYEDIYDEWIAYIKSELLLRNDVNEEAIFYIPHGDIFMALHSDNTKNNALRQKNQFTELYIKALTHFNQYNINVFPIDLAGINYSYWQTNRYWRENSWGSRSRCWSGHGQVLLADGSRKLIKHLCINDKVAVLEKLPYDVVTGYKTATVTVKIESIVNRKYDMVYVDNKLWITPYHAVLLNNEWKMPCNLNKIKQRFVTSIYNFILDRAHVLNVNGIWANTLGHDLAGDVIQNTFWGNSTAINHYYSQKQGYPNVVEYI